MDADPNPAAETRGRRTYVVLRYVRAVWEEPPVDEITPLGTVRADTLPETKVRARASWPAESAAGFCVRRASACRPGVLLEALAADPAGSRATPVRSLCGVR